jgi:Mg2+ and Co2+ transporter CorA
MRIDMLVQERAKNQDEVAHMVIDKCVGELCYVLELMEREIEHKDR